MSPRWWTLVFKLFEVFILHVLLTTSESSFPSPKIQQFAQFNYLMIINQCRSFTDSPLFTHSTLLFFPYFPNLPFILQQQQKKFQGPPHFISCKLQHKKVTNTEPKILKHKYTLFFFRTLRPTVLFYLFLLFIFPHITHFFTSSSFLCSLWLFHFQAI